MKAKPSTSSYAQVKFLPLLFLVSALILFLPAGRQLVQAAPNLNQYSTKSFSLDSNNVAVQPLNMGGLAMTNASTVQGVKSLIGATNETVYFGGAGLTGTAVVVGKAAQHGLYVYMPSTAGGIGVISWSQDGAPAIKAVQTQNFASPSASVYRSIAPGDNPSPSQPTTSTFMVGQDAAFTSDLMDLQTGTGSPQFRFLYNGDLNITGSFTASSITGHTNGVSASTGKVGEILATALSSGSSNSLTSGSTTTIISRSLAAGDYLVSGNANLTATSLTSTGYVAGIGTTVGTLPTDGTEVPRLLQTTTLTFNDSVTLPPKHIVSSTSFTVYLMIKPTFSAGTCRGYGFLNIQRQY